MNYIKQRCVVFVDEDNNLLAGLFMNTGDKLFQTHIGV